ncbi:MAG: energy-coupling factor transporter transmembrane protein EcfT [Thermofilum sp.]|nr:energy-coupling factor transporter transmembrane protein EcfT [Thermofilum sp.]
MPTLLEEFVGVRVGGSPYLRLHSVTRIIVPFLLSLNVLFAKDLLSVAALCTLSFAVLLLSGVPLRVVRGYLALIASVTIFIALAFMLFTKVPGRVLWELQLLRVQAERGVWEWSIVVTDASLLRTLYFSLRILSMIFIATLFIATVGDRDMLWGLRRLGLPAGITVGASLFFRGIGFFLSDFAVVKEAMEARGVDFERTNLAKRFMLYVNALIPLLSLLVTRSFEISTALETRGISPGTRLSGSYHSTPLSRGDYLVLAAMCLVTLAFAGWFMCG